MKTILCSLMAALALISPASAVMQITVAEDSPLSLNGWWSVTDAASHKSWDMVSAIGILGVVDIWFYDDPEYLRCAMWPDGEWDFSEDTFHISETGRGGGYVGDPPFPALTRFNLTWESKGPGKISGTFAMYKTGGRSAPLAVSVPEGGSSLLFLIGGVSLLALTPKGRSKEWAGA